MLFPRIIAPLSASKKVTHLPDEAAGAVRVAPVRVLVLLVHLAAAAHFIPSLK